MGGLRKYKGLPRILKLLIGYADFTKAGGEEAARVC